ncbi:hypothetical protein M011DRAFT_337117 [Sporormia fimetaria CBS 119925]|uniref:SET domain-containing protein n=1 Tax=Sporormia fimetaria CBS 119925 TaxID=1340428 RepID=A0A6A6VG46_9PLEO|nr:hypothetical protein M011DRAFT_337117 [Sporormia fimetaria CBS 119925]
MTNVSPIKAHADLQPSSIVLYGDHQPPTYSNGSPTLDNPAADEESSTIKCICGFSDDDGNTVLCEKCNTWQHILCYYESAHLVPDVHECTDCFPRPVDKKRASENQLQRRAVQNANERRGRPKTTAKNHKKRLKDSVSSIHVNGWAAQSNQDYYYPDQNAGSPRDHPPPKRSKTSHRSSGSVSVVSEAPSLAPGSRKRASSTAHNCLSPVKSPTTPMAPEDVYSPEFMNLYRQPDPPPTEHADLFTDIGVAKDMTDWLNDRDALAEATGGREPAQVFQRIDRPIEQYEQQAPIITKQLEEDPSVTAHGLHPQWQFLTVDTYVPKDAYIGEIRGRIGRKRDYCADPRNRWELLRHPEPFVFFPPYLPIYIDMRHESNILRYMRRSCNPNVHMKILTGGVEDPYHFCFVAKADIQSGEELTLGWEIDAEIRQRLNDAIYNGDLKKEGFKQIEPWVACLLANFGGCACDKSRRDCLLERARTSYNVSAEIAPSKAPRTKKARKAHVSPISTGQATNSRAGSESHLRNGVDDDPAENRSTSGSHKSTSRDITPATHFSVDAEPKLSDRERRKIQQQERLFEQLEYDEQHKGKRGKRNSAGSALTTPALSSSVRRSSRPILFDANATAQKQLGLSEPSPTARQPREHSHGVARKTSGSKTSTRAQRKPKPVYVDSSILSPTTERLPTPVTVPDLHQRSDTFAAHADEVKDVEMKDAEADAGLNRSEPKDVEMPDAPVAQQTNPEMLPPQRPVHSGASAPVSPSVTIDGPSNTHHDEAQPAVPDSEVTSKAAPVVVTTPSESAVVQLPVEMPSLQSPVSPAAAPPQGPVRKKMSLSAYTNHRKKLLQKESSGAGATTLSAPGHPISSPTLTAASLSPSQTSASAKVSDRASPAPPPQQPNLLAPVSEETKDD